MLLGPGIARRADAPLELLMFRLRNACGPAALVGSDVQI
jgi:hypothetical protein